VLRFQRSFGNDNKRIFMCLNISHCMIEYHLQRSEEAEENKLVVFTRKGGVSVIFLNGDERIPSDAGELMRLTIVAENYVPVVADESVLFS
jgi:hypothetical protein